ncbi:hypothetical protein ACP4OV_015157 [Aristida adscensionis]
MGKRHLSFLVTFIPLFIFMASPVIATDNSTTPTTYQMLEDCDFPRGILPQGVTGYVLDSNGSFKVYLQGDCNIRAGKIQICYNSRIPGNVQNRSITGLEGVKAKILFSWIGIDQVARTTNDKIQFYSGILTKLFHVDTFANSPQCN